MTTPMLGLKPDHSGHLWQRALPGALSRILIPGEMFKSQQ